MTSKTLGDIDITIPQFQMLGTCPSVPRGIDAMNDITNTIPWYFNSQYSRTTWLSWHQNIKPFWVLLQHFDSDYCDSEICAGHLLPRWQAVCIWVCHSAVTPKVKNRVEKVLWVKIKLCEEHTHARQWDLANEGRAWGQVRSRMLRWMRHAWF